MLDDRSIFYRQINQQLYSEDGYLHVVPNSGEDLYSYLDAPSALYPAEPVATIPYFHVAYTCHDLL